MKVLVTGVTGRVGANVAAELLKKGWDVRGLVVPGDPQKKKLDRLPNVEIVEASLTDQEGVNRAVDGVTHIVHLAAQLIRGTTPVDTFYDINALGTLRLLEAFVRGGQPMGRFVLASTDGTYCPTDPPEMPLKETTPQQPADYYGAGKLLGEVILRNHAKQYDIPFSIVRFSTVVSPEEAQNLFRFNFVNGLLSLETKGKDSHIWPMFENGRTGMAETVRQVVGDKADLNPAIDLIDADGKSWALHLGDVRDIAQGVVLALEHPNALGEAFNIAGPPAESFTDCAKAVAAKFDLPLFTVTLPYNWQLIMDINKAESMLGFAPRWTYQDMLDTNIDEAGVLPARVA